MTFCFAFSYFILGMRSDRRRGASIFVWKSALSSMDQLYLSGHWFFGQNGESHAFTAWSYIVLVASWPRYTLYHPTNLAKPRVHAVTEPNGFPWYNIKSTKVSPPSGGKRSSLPAVSTQTRNFEAETSSAQATAASCVNCPDVLK